MPRLPVTGAGTRDTVVQAGAGEAVTADRHVVAVPLSGAPTALGWAAVTDVLAPARYQVRVCAAGPVAGFGGVLIKPAHPLDTITTAGTVFLTSVPDPRHDRCTEWAPLLHAAAGNGTRLVATGTGVFALAEAGLLDGRRVAVHWPHIRAFRARYPAVRVIPDAILTTDTASAPAVITAAGGSAVLDACLHLIRADHGPGTAQATARRFLVPGARLGGQYRFAAPTVVDPDADAALGGLLSYLTEHLEQPWTLDTIAARAGIPRRTLHRHFRAATSTTPLDWLIQQRVHAAQRLLTDTDTPLDDIAAAVGFDSTTTLRYHLRRRTGTSLAAHRRQHPPGQR